MAEQPTIVADPISSDASEDSWILLDEMEEAMNEIDGVANEPLVKEALATTIPEILIETAEMKAEIYQPSRFEEVHNNDDVNKIDFESKIGSISSDLIDTCSSDDNSDSEHMYSSRPYDYISHTPTIDDGSTTDGSISIISRTEFHRYETRRKRKSSKDGKDQLDMLMNRRPIRGRCAMSVEELTMEKPFIVDEVINFLERLNDFFATTYLGQVFLLFVTIVSLTSYSIMYHRYTNIKLAFNDLNQQYSDLGLKSTDMEHKLESCEYLYERELKNKNDEPNVLKSIVTAEDQKTCNIGTKYFQKSDYAGLIDEQEGISPTKSSRLFETDTMIDKTETISAFNDDFIDNFDANFDEDWRLPSTRDPFERIVSNFDLNIEFESLASIMVKMFKETEDNRDVDTEATTEYKPNESGTLCEHDSDSDVAQKYVQDAHIQHKPTKSHKSMNDESKSRKEEKKIEKTKKKWDKDAVKIKDYAIDRSHSSEETEENIIEWKEKAKRERIHRKENVNYYNNIDHKESKGKKNKHDKENHDSRIWNKAARKRAAANNYGHRYDD